MGLSRSPGKNFELQTDAEGKGFNFLRLNAVGNVQQATLHVDPSLAVEIGARGTGVPFKSLAAAVAAAAPGDTIILRPGVHGYDGFVDIFHLPGLTIIGPGAIIKSATESNETTKLLIRSDNVKIDGIEFDGAFDTASILVEGAIHVDHAVNVEIANVYVHNNAGNGIYLVDGYDGVSIHGCTIQACGVGIYAAATDGRDTDGVVIYDNVIKANRSQSIFFNGPGVTNGFAITGIRISGNEIFSNDSLNAVVPSVILSQSCRGVRFADNRVYRENIGVLVSNSEDINFIGNHLRSIAFNHVTFTGCKSVTMTGNTLDGRNVTGTQTATSGIIISGFYLAANDAGPYLIEGNSIVNFKAASFSISVSNANYVAVLGNVLYGPATFTAILTLEVEGNLFIIVQTTQAILLDAGNRASAHLSVVGNHFRFTGASISRAIATVDASANGIDDVAIIGNSSEIGVTFGIASYGHSGSNPASHVMQVANTPESADVTVGWANAGTPVNQVIVSKAFGLDASGARQSRTMRFKTINAAITAAVSGDTVIVEDGVFNERISAKNGITVRFLPLASLVCTSVGGCLLTTATDQQFTLYHEHLPIVCSENTTDAVSSTHSGAYLALHCSINQTGAGVLPTGLRVSDGTVEIWGYVHSANSIAISTAASGSPVVIVHGGLTGNYDVQGNSIALSCLRGFVKLIDATIIGVGAGIELNASVATLFCKRCSIAADGSGPAVNISTVGSNVPTFRDSILVSGSSATQSIAAGAAQTVRVMGSVMANKGADPPTNVTFTGGGIYTVNAGVILD